MNYDELKSYWHSRGLSTRAAWALARLNCENDADIRALAPWEIRQTNCGRVTVEEIGRVLFDEDWRKVQRVPSNLCDQTLIGELERRGYKVHKVTGR